MPKKSKTGKTRHDKWYHLAKEQGYRSRASFKLVQLNKKYDFLSSSRALLDLCAAPGGWLQVAQKFMPSGSLIIGVDLLPIKAIPGVVTLQQDILTQKCRQQIKKESNGWKFDTVIHDGAPNVGGNKWSQDAYGQIELVLHSLRLSTEFLKPGGHFITKVFRSQDYNALLWVMQQFFKKVDVTKPTASRNTSAEIYMVGLGFLAPKSIDPRLLDPAHVFKTPDAAAADQQRVADVLKGANTKKRANRGGYADGARVLYSEATAADFVEGDDPLDTLGRHNRIVFDGDESRAYAGHAATTDEVRALCDDLKVVGKNDFRRLLKWRGVMRDFRRELLAAERGAGAGEDAAAAAAAAEAEAERAAAEAAMTPEERARLEDERLTKELKEMQQRVRHRERVARRKRREEKFKARRRAAMSLNAADVGDDDNVGQQEGLFSLRRIPDAGALDSIEMDGARSDASASGTEGGEEEGGSEPPSDEDDEARAERLNRELESLYGQYKDRRKIQSLKEKKMAKKVGFFVGEEAEDAAATAAAEAVMFGGGGGGEDDDDEEDEEDEDEAGADNPLVLSLGAGRIGQTPEARARRWFDGDLFEGVAGDADAQAAAPRKRKQAAGSDSGSDSDSSEEEGDKVKAKDKVKVKATGKRKPPPPPSSSSSDEDSDPEVRRRKRLAKKSGFEEVPEQGSSDWSDDSDARAEVLALGQRFLHKRSREALEDAAYNRYAWGEEDLPEWFVNDEEAHNKPAMPVTKEEVDSFKAQLQAINARPAKKIAEARARKKIKKVARLEKMKAQAESIVKSDGLSNTDKLRSIQKLYSGDKGKKKKVERTYVVARKSGGQLQAEARRGASGPVQVVDKRLKSDKRGQKRAEERRRRAGKRRRR